MGLCTGVVSTRTATAFGAELLKLTFVHWTLGRRSCKEVDIAKWALTLKEEEHLIWCCSILQRAGFPLPRNKITVLACLLRQKRLGLEVTLSPHCIDKSFYTRYPKVKTQFSEQLDGARVWQENNCNAIEKFFDNIEKLFLEFNIRLQNKYDFDKTGFVIGNAATEVVFDVQRGPRPARELWPSDMIEE
jgi:hypothetical protein